MGSIFIVGTAAGRDVGTDVGDIPELEDVGGGVAGLPAVDGSQLTGLPSGVSSHDALTGLGADDHAQYHTDGRGDTRYYQKGEVDTALGLKANTADLGTAAAEDVGTAAGEVVQLDGSGRLPAVDGSLLIGLPSGVNDHGALTGLADDDHLQYHTDARGDARYHTQATVDAQDAAAQAAAEATAAADARFPTTDEKAALTAAPTAANAGNPFVTLADSRRVYVQDTEPPGMVYGDAWIDTSP